MVNSLERLARRLVFWLVLLFGVIFTYFSVYLHLQQSQVDSRPVQEVIHGGFQLRLEFMTLQMRVARAVLTNDPADIAHVEEAYDILWSRLEMIESKPNLHLPVGDKASLERYLKIAKNVRSFDPIVSNFLAGDLESGKILEGKLNALTIEFSTLLTDINVYFYSWFNENDRVFGRFLGAFILVAIFSVGLIVLLARSLLRSARATDRSQAELTAALIDLSGAKEKAEAANTAKSHFLASVSHELRTPLNAIIGFSEILMDKTLSPKSDERRQAYLGHVVSSGHHLLSLINDILDFSKIQQGHWTIRAESLEVRSEVEEVVLTMSAAAAAKEVSLVVDLEQAPARIVSDTRALRQILFNVLSNAVKFSPAGGDVTVRVRRSGEGALVIEIDDQGPGLDEDFLEEVGKPFSQGQAPSLSGESGTGLGLAITIELLNKLGGRFKIGNRATGGAHVEVTIPTDVAGREESASAVAS